MSLFRRPIFTAIWCFIPLLAELVAYHFSTSAPSGSRHFRAGKSIDANLPTLVVYIHDVRDLMGQPLHSDLMRWEPELSSFERFRLQMAPENWSILGFSMDSRSEAITAKVKNCVYPSLWQDIDSDVRPTTAMRLLPSVRELQGQLIVVQTEENQARIIALLNRLRFHQWLLQHLPYYYLPWIVFTLVLIGSRTVCRSVSQRIARAAERRRNGLCVHCGYDLRESRERCPECGVPTPHL